MAQSQVGTNGRRASPSNVYIRISMPSGSWGPTSTRPTWPATNSRSSPKSRTRAYQSRERATAVTGSFTWWKPCIDAISPRPLVLERARATRRKIVGRTLLKEAVDVASAGDEPVALLDLPYLAEIRAEPAGRRALAAWMSLSRAIFERVAPTSGVSTRTSGHSRTASLPPCSTRRAHTSRASRSTGASDIIFTIVSPEVFMLLTAERGWTPAEWESFVTGAVADAVLA
jgi:hypothetical protein